MKTIVTHSRTSLRHFLTAITSILLVIPQFYLHAAHFSFHLFAVDAAGNADTVIIGYRPDAQSDLNHSFGERNLIQRRIRNGLDVRITNAYSRSDATAHPFETNIKWLPFECMGNETGYNLAIYTNHWPVTLHWDSTQFSDSCRNASTLANVPLNSPFVSSQSFEIEMAESSLLKITRESLEQYYNVHQNSSLSVLHGSFKCTLPALIDLDYESAALKEGWNLIFHDDFNGTEIDTLLWNISDDENDGTGDCLPEQNMNIPMNPANIGVSGGKMHIQVTADPYDGCDYSGGEIKTFGWDQHFTTYFRKSGYLEIRAKLPIEDGIGSAAWLYTGNGPKYSEIDLWETRGIKNQLTCTYHWDYATKGLARAQSGQKIGIYDIDTASHPFGPQPLFASTDLSQHFLTYGLEWDDEKVTWYVNGVAVRSIQFKSGNSRYKGYPPEEALMLRLSAGGDLCRRPNNDFCFPDPAMMPKALEIDYVRVYIKEGFESVAKFSSPVICAKPTILHVRVSHYPQASYQFNAPWLTGYHSVLWDVYKMTWRLTADGSQPANQLVPLYLTTSFPWGYQEQDTFLVDIRPNPAPPTGSIHFEPLNNTCLYRALVQKTNSSDTYYWSVNNGQSFVSGTNESIGGVHYSGFAPIDAGASHHFKIKATNICGSDHSYANFATAPDGNAQAGCTAKWNGNTTSEHAGSDVRIDHVKVFSITGNLIERCLIGAYDPEGLRQRLGSGLYLVQFFQKNGIVQQSKKMIIAR